MLPLYSSQLPDCSTQERSGVLPRRHSFPMQEEDASGDIQEEIQCRYSERSVLFSLVKKWLQIRGCCSRATLLRIVHGRKSVGSIFSKCYKPEETIPSAGWKLCNAAALQHRLKDLRISKTAQYYTWEKNRILCLVKKVHTLSFKTEDKVLDQLPSSPKGLWSKRWKKDPGSTERVLDSSLIWTFPGNSVWWKRRWECCYGHFAVVGE